MKRTISLLLLAMALSFNFTSAFADEQGNPKRVKELQQEAQMLLEERQKYLSEITRIEVRLYEINGALKEISPKPAAKEEAKK